jgi:hypothetical protein
MKQTAVEWLVKELESFGDPGSCKIKWEQLDLLIEQAKEMEKEQIMDAYIQGDIFGADYYDGVNITEENYYNKTFKSE